MKLHNQSKSSSLRPREWQAVSQEHALGCGVACVASRCGTSYREALEEFSRPENAWTRGYYCPEIVAALKKLGYDYEFAPFNSREHGRLLSRAGTIAFVAPCRQYPAGHFLLRTDKGWMNSWLNYPQMVPVECGFEKKLPGRVTYIVFERN